MLNGQLSMQKRIELIFRFKKETQNFTIKMTNNEERKKKLSKKAAHLINKKNYNRSSVWFGKVLSEQNIR